MNFKKIGIIGFGNFGQLVANILKPNFKIRVTNRSDKSNLAKDLGFEYLDLKTLVQTSEVLIFCVPVQFLEKTLEEIKPFLKEKSCLIDTASVKVKPTEFFMKILGEEMVKKQITFIPTHPLFGPNSFAKNGNETDGLKLVLCNDEELKKQAGFEENYNLIKEFSEEKLKLKVFKKTTTEHDKEMAWVQGLTFYLGKTFERIHIPDTELKTPTYQHLLDIKEIVSSDSDELFDTIMEFNPFVREALEQFENSKPNFS
jgi:prephenate dehydrogenase